MFRVQPRLPYGVKPIPDNIAPDTTAAYYQPGAAAAAHRVLHGLCRTLGAVCRKARPRDGALRRPVRPLRPADLRDVARTAPGDRHEVDRYLDTPGQALAYQIGLLKILELREHAQRVLGPAYDVRDFNEAVLATGSVPLPALEAHIER